MRYLMLGWFFFLLFCFSYFCFLEVKPFVGPTLYYWFTSIENYFLSIMTEYVFQVSQHFITCFMTSLCFISFFVSLYISYPKIKILHIFSCKEAVFLFPDFVPLLYFDNIIECNNEQNLYTKYFEINPMILFLESVYFTLSR